MLRCGRSVLRRHRVQSLRSVVFMLAFRNAHHANETQAFALGASVHRGPMKIPQYASGRYELGGDEQLDLLALPFPRTDYPAHSLGPNSWECIEYQIRAGRALGDYSDTLGQHTELAVVLTAGLRRGSNQTQQVRQQVGLVRRRFMIVSPFLCSTVWAGVRQLTVEPPFVCSVRRGHVNQPAGIRR